ncbi:MAG: TraR/DksA family transcriptional regulator [Proteobacteria bacterium]|nr:TraR/DksA family transcriptional regulator [Pseudomonadota bacterium]
MKPGDKSGGSTPRPDGPENGVQHWLLNEEARLLGQIEELRGNVRAAKEAGEIGDEEDLALALAEEEELIRKILKKRGDLAQVRYSLTRFHEGEYGFCEDCGEEIPARRLELMPWVTRCVNCQAGSEQAARKRACNEKFGLPWTLAHADHIEEE